MLISKFGSAEKSEIISFNPDLPKELVRFLEKYNGGETPETQFNMNGVSSDIVAFYGIGNVKYSYNDVDIIQMQGGKYLPIAFDSFGNQIVIALKAGNVFFYYHDHERSKLSKELAPNFSAFLSEVNSQEINPKHTKPIPEREQDLINRGHGGNITDELRAMWQNEIDKYSHFHQEKVVL